jgi:hypothetical protein
VLTAGDEIIVIATDEESVEVVPPPADAIDADAIPPVATAEIRPERTLILGWNQWVPVVVRELDRYAAPGSSLTVVAPPAYEGEIDQLARSHFDHTIVTVTSGDPTQWSTLQEQLTQGYEQVAVFGDARHVSPEDADANTLVTLLHAREIVRQRGHRVSLVAEVLDPRTRELAEITRADDFVVSERIVALLLAQIATVPARARVFEDLLDADGAEIYLKPAEYYARLERSVSFYTVIEAARRRGELAIGYRVLGGGAVMRLNPLKTGLVRFSTGDRIVVVAHEPG